MLFSIITICLNSEKEIRKTIESVLSQTYPEIEYIIKDGASSDRTVEIANEYKELFRKKGYIFKIISEKDYGIYDAMNSGIHFANGELVGMINAGDWYEPNMVEMAVCAYTESPYDIFFSNINLYRENGKCILKRARLDIFPSSRHWNHPTMVVKRTVYDELGLFRNEGIYDDFDFYLRARRANKKIKVCDIVLAGFVMGGASNSKSLSKSIGRLHDRYQCYRNNGYSRLYIIECIAMETAKMLLV